MNYLISVDVETARPIDRDLREVLKMALATIITDNMEDCDVRDVRFGQYLRAGDELASR